MRIPSLRKHATGQWFTHWGGRDHYFGHDKEEAESLYVQSLQEWHEWRDSRRAERDRRQRMTRLAVAELVQQFTNAKRIETGEDAARYYENHLTRFNHIYGALDADLIRPKHLNALKLSMINDGYAPKTINHDLTAIRVMFNWASGLELIEAINLRGVKNMPVGPVKDKTVSEQRVREGLVRAPQRLRPWMAINYLALLRPSEVVRVVRGEGEWVSDGVFRLDKGKMDRRASIKRHCVFSDRALRWLRRCELHWTRYDSYYAACARAFPEGPKVLQKSAATHLVHCYGANPADVELLLGHVPGRLGVTYYLPAFDRLRQVSAQLLQRSASQVVPDDSK